MGEAQPESDPRLRRLVIELSKSFGYFNPPLTPEERGIAAIEGWVLGVNCFVCEYGVCVRKNLQ